jgi:UDP:flavonoid glycosyltransferase YjiC (YdhE family)
MTRVLFSVPGKRGLGHVMRGLNLARAARTLDPAVRCRFASRGTAALEVIGDEFEVIVTDDGQDPVTAAATDFAADVVVYDTALPATTFAAAQAVYVMRRSLPDRQAEVFASPVLTEMGLILIPHTAEEFGYPVPPELTSRCLFAGPISRLPTPEGVAAMRQRYAGKAPFLLTSTVGGGGFADQAEEFFRTIAEAHAALQPGVTHVVVVGPNYAGPPPEVPGAMVVRFEPALVDLLAASDLVIAEGGYNTVTEVRLAKTPAVFLPSRRNWDDQVERVRALQDRGLARVMLEDDADRTAGLLAAVNAVDWQADVRRAYATDAVATGNAAAAAAILALATNRS